MMSEVDIVLGQMQLLKKRQKYGQKSAIWREV